MKEEKLTHTGKHIEKAVSGSTTYKASVRMKRKSSKII